MSALRQGRKSNGGNTSCRKAQRTSRGSGLESHAEDHRGAGDPPPGAPALHARDFESKKILRPRRKERSACGRRGSARRNAPALETEALEAEGNCAQDRAGTGIDGSWGAEIKKLLAPSF